MPTPRITDHCTPITPNQDAHTTFRIPQKHREAMASPIEMKGLAWDGSKERKTPQGEILPAA